MTIRTRIAVIGVGNDFRRDDGVGWTVIDRLREQAAVRPFPTQAPSWPRATATPHGS